MDFRFCVVVDPTDVLNTPGRVLFLRPEGLVFANACSSLSVVS